MGTWSEDAFGNDVACDWASDFVENPSMEAVEKAIDAVIDEDAYLDADTACEGLVACEIVARLNGNLGLTSAYSAGVDSWVRASSVTLSASLISKAARAVDRVLVENSELRELWDEGGVDEDWHREMASLRSRIIRETPEI
jgi:hypothetical protein